MIPYLIRGDLNIAQENFGKAYLTDCISATVTEELLGAYSLKISYPIGGNNWKHLRPGNKIYCYARGTDGIQTFIITRVVKTMGGNVAVDAEHLSYFLANIISGGFSANNNSEFVTNLLQNAEGLSAYNFNIIAQNSVSGEFDCTNKPYRNIKDLLFGKEDSYISLYGGEAKFSNYNVYLVENRGVEKDFSVDYGVNLSALTHSADTRTYATAIYPYYYSNDVLLQLPEKIIITEASWYSDVFRTEIVDLTDKFEEEPSEQQLREAAADWLAENNAYTGTPENIKVKFVDSDNHASELLDLGDSIKIKYSEFGQESYRKIIKTVYDVISEKYVEIEVGDALSRFSETLLRLIKRV